MAQIIGHLREDKATRGEKLVLKKLKTSLPDDFYVYVECPLSTGRMQRFPDFIIVCNFGVVVLEVKDWVYILEATPHQAKIRRRGGQIVTEKSPVLVAREYALLLQDELKKMPERFGEQCRTKVPWGYAAVLPNLPPTAIARLREVWDEPHVLGRGDLESHVATKRLRRTLPPHNQMLRRHELRCVRGVIYPVVRIVPEEPGKPAVILDQDQERIVAEPPRVSVEEKKPATAPAVQQVLLETLEQPTLPRAEDEELLPIEQDVVLNASIRLVRGVAGSGKTLVLTRRAQYLAALYPEWQICVLSYNKLLAQFLRANLRGFPAIKRVTTFDGLCAALLKRYMKWKEPSDPKGWIQHHIEQWPIAQRLGVDFVSHEIKWIKEMGIGDRETYLRAKRKGRGRGLQTAQREQVYDLLEAYQEWLDSQQAYDWTDVPYLVLQGMDEGKIKTGIYDAILIDEAQDFAPVWLSVVKRLLKPEGGLLFLANDPSQSIYRYYSWREKGVPVVGRTRWLRIPYRNTREIYQAAYEVIRHDEVLKHQLAEQRGGLIVEPDLTSEYLRSGPRPELRRFPSPEEEFAFIRSEIERLLQQGLGPEEIIVLHRRKSGVRRLKRRLRGLGVRAETCHAPKGLEYEVVFLSQMQETFVNCENATEEEISQERRLVYMAMTRARQRLYLNYEGRWPEPLEGVLEHVDRVLI